MIYNPFVIIGLYGKVTYDLRQILPINYLYDFYIIKNFFAHQCGVSVSSVAWSVHTTPSWAAGTRTHMLGAFRCSTNRWTTATSTIMSFRPALLDRMATAALVFASCALSNTLVRRLARWIDRTPPRVFIFIVRASRPTNAVICHVDFLSKCKECTISYFCHLGNYFNIYRYNISIFV